MGGGIVGWRQAKSLPFCLSSLPNAHTNLGKDGAEATLVKEIEKLGKGDPTVI